MEIPIYPNIREDLELIETFLWDPEKGAPDIDLHLERMCKSAANLKFKFEIIKIKQKILEINSQSRLRCRLTLRIDGTINLTTAPTPILLSSTNFALKAVAYSIFAPPMVTGSI